MYRTDANAAPSARAAAAAAARPLVHAPRYRSRDFGTGYGSSSGYAASRRYTPGSQPLTRFRLA
ncbi:MULTISPECIES: hypothetical protein [unclassified Luteimonas]|uniref:hypothetical protein n=1 Tax=unclassified Luteimonas TaxID=2629088 RepID=UPI0018F08A9B|nr:MULTISPECIES: hypothetical protein [unclassified Luteimonas]MBJ6979803.1 hypothetical protein [Luteimonas sp. MC1895]MBJ6985505.1 hypothetical protein [Luteimonas sp. MC1750]QQO06009.1 hypothetical protein JGR68_00655 [Luteimonas sp. MC1750]